MSKHGKQTPKRFHRVTGVKIKISRDKESENGKEIDRGRSIF